MLLGQRFKHMLLDFTCFCEALQGLDLGLHSEPSLQNHYDSAKENRISIEKHIIEATDY